MTKQATAAEFTKGQIIELKPNVAGYFEYPAKSGKEWIEAEVVAVYAPTKTISEYRYKVRPTSKPDGAPSGYMRVSSGLLRAIEPVAVEAAPAVELTAAPVVIEAAPLVLAYCETADFSISVEKGWTAGNATRTYTATATNRKTGEAIATHKSTAPAVARERVAAKAKKALKAAVVEPDPSEPTIATEDPDSLNYSIRWSTKENAGPEDFSGETRTKLTPILVAGLPGPPATAAEAAERFGPNAGGASRGRMAADLAAAQMQAVAGKFGQGAAEAAEKLGNALAGIPADVRAELAKDPLPPTVPAGAMPLGKGFLLFGPSDNAPIAKPTPKPALNTLGAFGAHSAKPASLDLPGLPPLSEIPSFPEALQVVLNERRVAEARKGIEAAQTALNERTRQAAGITKGGNNTLAARALDLMQNELKKMRAALANLVENGYHLDTIFLAAMARAGAPFPADWNLVVKRLKVAGVLSEWHEFTDSRRKAAYMQHLLAA